MNSRKQGDIGTGVAIAFFLSDEYTVAIPISDSQSYDLIIEKDSRCLRVQVKTCFKKNKHNTYNVELRTVSNTRGKKLDIRHLSKDDCNLVFIVDGDNKKYLISSSVLDGRRQISTSMLQDFMVG